jgi:hypothetical protein
MGINSSGGLQIQGDFPRAPACLALNCPAPNADTWVRGYSEIGYGNPNAGNAPADCLVNSNPPANALGLKLPTQLKDIAGDLIGTTGITFNMSKVTNDVAYDMWLNNTGDSVCEPNGTLEVMVWLDYDQGALLPSNLESSDHPPISYSVTNSSGQSTYYSGKNAWSLYSYNLEDSGQTAAGGGTVTMVLNAGIGNSLQGSVSVDLSNVFSDVGSYLQSEYKWSNFEKTYWLDNIEFGTEFGPLNGASTGNAVGPAIFGLGVSSFCLGVGTTIETARCA